MNKNMLEHKTGKLKELIDEYKALDMIREPLGVYISKNHDIESALVEIEKTTGVSAETAKGLINKYRIHKMFTLNTDTTDIDNQIQEHKNNLKNLDNFVMEEYNEL